MKEKNEHNEAGMPPAQEATPATPLSLLTLPKKVELTAEVEFRDGVFLSMRYVPRAVLTQLSREATVMRFDNKAGARLPDLDGKKLATGFSRRAVTGWSGMTARKASLLVALDLSGLTEEQKDTAIPFSVEQLDFLVVNCYDLDSFIQRSAMDLGVFNPDHVEEAGN